MYSLQNYKTFELIKTELNSNQMELEQQITTNLNNFVVKNEPLNVEIAEPIHFTFEPNSSNYSNEVPFYFII